MPTNKYFQSGKGMGSREEQNLLQVLVNESIQIVGSDFVYIPRNIVKLDNLFNEDYLSSFTRNYSIEMYIENFSEFEGDGELISKFGLIVSDKLRLVVSKERFGLIMGAEFPSEGDLIYYPTSKALFEIKFIDDKKPIMPLGSRQYFTLICETFKYSNEILDTGSEADIISKVYSNDGATGIGDPFAKNDYIQIKSDVLLNFDESDPFAEKPV
jgi:hypothetical protein